MSAVRAQRVVIDPNVYISAILTPQGAPAQIITLIDEGALVPVLNRQLVDEVVEVLRRPKLARYVLPGTGAVFQEQMQQLAEWHADISDPPGVTRDVKDDYIVALAVSVGVEAIVSGDRDLLDGDALGVPVLSPRELLDRLESFESHSVSSFLRYQWAKSDGALGE